MTRSPVVLAAAAAFLIVSGNARAEVFSDLFLGAAITEDSTYTVNGVPITPSILCLSDCSSAASPAGGLRVGYWIDSLPWLGIAGDFSVFVPAWGIESPYEVTAYPLTALVALRAPLVKREGYPNGRVQPYLAVGPGLFISTGELSEGLAFLGTGRTSSDTDVAVGADLHAGVELLASDWIGVFLEYRYTYFAPSYSIAGDDVSTDFSTHHINLGIGIHY